MSREAPPREPPIPSRGHASIEVALEAGRSVVRRSRAESPLRILTPTATGGSAAWVVTSSFGGGIVEGDDLRVDLIVREGAKALFTTQATTKVYPGVLPARQTITVDVLPGGAAFCLPDPTSCFAGAKFVQDVHVALADRTSALVWCDVLTAGRVARDERWDASRISSRLTLRRADETILRDAIELDPAHGDLRARMTRFDAVGTLVVLGPRLADVASALVKRTRAPHPDDRAVFAASPLAAGEGVVARFAATDVEAAIALARDATAFVADLIGVDPWSRRP
jgi:urease accessory protein